MNQLIWFSIPGSILIGAMLIIFSPCFSTSGDFLYKELSSIILVLAVPITGFVAHQLFRLVFELSGGFSRKSRTVLKYIANDLAATVDIPKLSIHNAFLVWEITFYSDAFPSSFRNHNRNTWHYILSFWGMSLSLLMAYMMVINRGSISVCNESLYLDYNWLLSGLLIAAVLFYWKGSLSHISLKMQELAIAHKYRKLFTDTLLEFEGMIINSDELT